MKELIEKYTHWLNTMKSNRKAEGDTWSDDTTKEVDARIRELAGIITDLKALQVSENSEVTYKVQMLRDGEWKDIKAGRKTEYDSPGRVMGALKTSYYGSLRHGAHTKETLRMVKCTKNVTVTVDDYDFGK
jgi:hypothetical protein